MHSPVIRHETRDDHRIDFSQTPYQGCRGVDFVYVHVCEREIEIEIEITNTISHFVRMRVHVYIYSVCVYSVCVCICPYLKVWWSAGMNTPLTVVP